MKTPAVVSLSLLLPAFVFADSMSFTPSQDASIMDNDTSVNVGSLFAGYNAGGQERRALVMFDLSAIPSGSTIDSVSLTLFAAQLQGSQSFELRALTTAWTEGTNTGNGGQGGQGTTPTPTGSVSWNTPWSTTGGDFGAVLDSQSVSGTGAVVFSGASLLAAVQGWVDTPSGNQGLILIGTNTPNQNAVRFDSSENGTAPSLAVDYTPVPEPETYALLAGIGCLGLIALRRKLA